MNHSNDITPHRFIRSLDDWIAEGGAVPEFENYFYSTLEEASAVLRALEYAHSILEQTLEDSPLAGLSRILRYSEREAATYLAKHASSPIRNMILARIGSDSSTEFNVLDPILDAMDVLIRMGFDEDLKLLARLASDERLQSQYGWNRLFWHLSEREQDPQPVVDAFDGLIPDKFCGIAFLDFSNEVCLDRRISAHPFDCEKGLKRLLDIINNSDGVDLDTYVVSAVRATPFLSTERARQVLKKAKRNSHRLIRQEAKWASAFCSKDQGVRFLEKKYQTIEYHTKAKRALRALGVDLPQLQFADAKLFGGLVEFSDWISDEQDYGGYPPDEIKLLDCIDIAWPDPESLCRFWRVRFKATPYYEAKKKTKTLYALVSSIGFEAYLYGDYLLAHISHAVEYDERYKHLVEQFPDNMWCYQRLRDLNPHLVDMEVEDAPFLRSSLK